MFCPHCGRQFGDSTRFCAGCGATLVQANNPAETPYGATSGTPAMPNNSMQPMGYAPAPKAPRANRTLPVVLGAAGATLLLTIGLIAGIGSMTSSNPSDALPSSSITQSEQTYDGADSESATSDDTEASDYSSDNYTADETSYESTGTTTESNTPTNINDLQSMYSNSPYLGTWTDPEYGDTLTLRADGSCTITQSDYGTTNWTWQETGSGIVISNNNYTHELYYTSTGTRTALQNDRLGLWFVR